MLGGRKWDKKMGVMYVGGRKGGTICLWSWGGVKEGSVHREPIPQSPTPKFIPNPEVPNIFNNNYFTT